jgi:transposase
MGGTKSVTSSFAAISPAATEYRTQSGHFMPLAGFVFGEETEFKGNTNDATTVEDKVAELRECYDLESVIFVGDRGMLTAARRKVLRGIEGLRTISALTHPELADLRKRDLVQLEFYDEKNIIEISDPEKEGERYCLCRNPITAASETQTRRRLIELSEAGLEKIAGYKQATTVEILGKTPPCPA